MKKKILISIGIFIGLLILLGSLINKEDLDFTTKYEFINTETLLKNQNMYVVYIFSSGCPAVQKKFPALPKELALLRENNIPYYLVADQIYNSRADRDLDELAEKYKLQGETIYLMDKNEFPVNGGLFNNKERYSNFIDKLTDGEEVPLGYIMHLTMKEGKLYSFAPFLEPKKLGIEN